MSRRPETLFPLFADLKGLSGVGPRSVENFANMGVTRPRDLIFTLPVNLVDRRVIPSIQGAQLPGVVTVSVTVGIHQPNQIKGRPYRVMVHDKETSFQLVFFHARADYLLKQLPEGKQRLVSGRIELFDGIGQMVHPDYILRPDQVEDLPQFEPIYPLTAGITQKTIFKATQGALERVPDLDEWIPSSVMSSQSFPDWKTALMEGHKPKSNADVLPNAPARLRLAFDEFFAHQITLSLARSNMRKSSGVRTQGDGRYQTAVLNALPFKPTNAQTRTIAEISDDMATNERMNRLLQGDVGSGKTLVALMALLNCVEANGQGVLMAPTEILARQHLEGLRPLVEPLGLRLDILTGRDKSHIRAEKLAALASGELHILVGTHAVFQNDVVFKDLRLAVIDEQHRFGVRQRMDLGAKGRAVDVLVMTATPIPRSLALVHYGDMDVSILDEKPAGRKPVDTVLVSSNRLDEVIERLRKAISEGRQCYWVCPLVEESEVLDLTSAEDRFRSLRVALGDNLVGMVHGQMKSAEKDAAMAAFVAGETKLLVATTVIEVGVDVPAASIIVIEGAEQFGLSQLHQLRGRVGRGAERSTCLLMYKTLGETARKRLETMRETDDGFVIAEQDLKIRGSGDLIGVAQSGLPRFQIADPESQELLMKLAHDAAKIVINADPKLESSHGLAVRTLLYLMDQDRGIRLFTVG